MADYAPYWHKVAGGEDLVEETEDGRITILARIESKGGYFYVYEKGIRPEDWGANDPVAQFACADSAKAWAEKEFAESDTAVVRRIIASQQP